MTRRTFVGAGLCMLVLASAVGAQTFTPDDIELRAKGLESKRVEVIERLSESIANLEQKNVSVIRSENVKVNQSELGLTELHGQFQIKLQEGKGKAGPQK
jgi:hypothetical protein